MTNKKVFSDNIAFFVQACDIGAEEEWLPPSGTRCLAHCTNITALSLHLQFDNRSQKYSQLLYRIFGAGRKKERLLGSSLHFASRHPRISRFFHISPYIALLLLLCRGCSLDRTPLSASVYFNSLFNHFFLFASVLLLSEDLLGKEDF